MGFWEDVDKGATDMWETEQVSGGGGDDGGGGGDFDIIGFLLKALLVILIIYEVLTTIFKLF